MGKMGKAFGYLSACDKKWDERAIRFVPKWSLWPLSIMAVMLSLALVIYVCKIYDTSFEEALLVGIAVTALALFTSFKYCLRRVK